MDSAWYLQSTINKKQKTTNNHNCQTRLTRIFDQSWWYVYWSCFWWATIFLFSNGMPVYLGDFLQYPMFTKSGGISCWHSSVPTLVINFTSGEISFWNCSEWYDKIAQFHHSLEKISDCTDNFLDSSKEFISTQLGEN